MKLWQWIILILCLLATVLLVYSPHFDYKYPLRYDEWANIAQGVHYLDKGFQEDLNFTNYPKNQLGAIDYEIGSHLILSFLFLFIDPVLHSKYLPALFAILTTLVLFYFLNKRYNFWTGIFAILFFTSLKNNVNISGPWFLTPQTMVFPLFFLFLFLLENKNWWSILVYLILFFMHPLTAFILLPISLIYLVTNIKQHKKSLIILSSIFAFIFLVYTKMLWQGSINSTLTYFLDLFLFKTYPETIKFFIPSFYGILSFLFAIIGCIILIKKRRLLFPISIFITLFLLFIYYKFNVQILISHSRLFYATLLLLVPLSAIGLNYSIKKLRYLFYPKIIIFFLIGLVLINAFYGYYPEEEKLKPYHLIEDSDYEALKWLENNYGSYNKIIVSKRFLSVLYPITKNYPHYSTFSSGNPENFDFFSESCGTRNYMIHKKFKARFVLAEEPIECEYLTKTERIYKKEELYIYKTTY